MLLAFTAIDYAVLAFYLLAVILVGGYFSRQQHSGRDFFLAGRAMGWFPVGLSVMATLLSALSYTGNPGQAYHVGMKMMLQPLAIWLGIPVMWMLVLPIFCRLDLYSIYEYFEYRFNLAVRLVATVLFVVWRLLWMGGVLYAPCKLLVVATGSEQHLVPLLLTLGAVGTAYTFLGGMKAVIWTDVIQTFVMFFGLVLIIAGVWASLDGGAARVTELAREYGRAELFQLSVPEVSPGREMPTFWSEKWLLWGMAPHFFLAMLTFYATDQITAQRFLTAKSLEDARQSFLLNCVSVTLMSAGLIYVGVALMAFYQANPQQMEPYWMVHAAKDPRTGEPLIDPETGRPYIDALRRRFESDAQRREALARLIRAGAILDPNRGEPLASIEQVLDPETGEIRMAKLARRDPETGEWRLMRGDDRLMPKFIVEKLWPGIAGLILAALLAASMSSMDSGLNSISTLIVTDVFRRLGYGRTFVAAVRGKPLEELDDGDELWLGRVLVLFTGIAATLFALAVSNLESIFLIMISVCNTFGAPLLGILFLGMLSRRATAPATFAALLFGMPFTIWLAFGKSWGLWPAWLVEQNPHAIWAVTFGVAGTMLVGYVLSFVLGRPKTERELAGLVAGCGELGIRKAPLEAATDEGEGRWS